MSNLVFVYGTLKKGYSNYIVMSQSGAKFLGEAITDPVYTMYHNGIYPAVIKNGDTAIHGEVYRVESLKSLDGLEGYPAYYNREMIETPYGKAWIYYLPSLIRPMSWNIVKSGYWGEKRERY